MIPKSATTALVAILAASLACGGKRVAETGVQPADAQLVIKNDHWLDVTVYAIPGGSRYRLETVPGLKRDTLPLKNSVFAGSGTIRFLLEPIGSEQTHLTEAVPIAGGDYIELTIRSPLNQTTLAVSHRVSSR